MKNIEKRISHLVENQFPSFYQEEGENFIAFVKAYYEWLESTDNPLYHARRLPAYRDIDETTDDFIVHFKEKYLKNIQFDTATNKKLLVKNALDLYRSKGTERSIDLFFKLVYGTSAEVRYPAEKLLRLSDGVFERPEYLEIGYSIYNIDYVGKQVIGQLSGAKAFVEKYIRRRAGKGYVNLLYISGRQGEFRNGEVIGLNLDNQAEFNIEKRSKLIGSIKRVTVELRGRDFNVGDIVKFVNSDRGIGGLARVESVNSQAGLVDFIFIDGGYGYTLNAESIVSEKVLNLDYMVADFTSDQYYSLFERGYQPVVNIGYSAANSSLGVGNTVHRYAANGMLAAEGRVLEVAPTSNTAGYISVSHTSGVFVPAASYYTTGNLVTFTADTTEDKSLSGKFMNTPTDYAITIVAPVGTFNVGDVVFQQNTGFATGTATVANVVVVADGTILNVTNARGVFKNSKRMSDWDYKAGTGTITTATNSITVTGTSTQFSNNYLNAMLYDDGNVALGTVSSIINSSSLALTSNALYEVTGNTHSYGLEYKLLNQTNPGVYANVSHINLNAGLYDIKKLIHRLDFEAGSSNNITFANNIYVYNSTGNVVSEARVITVNYNNSTNVGSLTFIPSKGYWNETDTVYTAANADNFRITTYTANVDGGDYVRSYPSKLIAPRSNSVSNVTSISFGSGAGFGVGTIGETEVIFIGTDLISANSEDTLDYSRVQLSITSNTGFVEGQRAYQQLQKIAFNPSTDVNPANGFISISNANTYYIAGDKLTYEVATGNTPVTPLESGKTYHVAFSNSSGLILSHPYNKFVHINSTSYPGETFANTSFNVPAFAAVRANQSGHFLYKVAHGLIYDVNGTTLAIKDPIQDFGNTSTVTSISFNANAAITNATDAIAITAANSFFLPGAKTTYTVAAGNTALTNLVSGTTYFIKTSNTTAVTLASTSGGATIDLTKGLTQTGHSLSVTAPANSNIIVYGTPTVNTAITAKTELATLVQANSVFASQFISSDAYGFNKNPQGNFLDLLYSCLTFGRFEIGIIGSLDQINPGADYNVDPFVLAHQPYVSAFGRKDLIISYENATRNFVVGEIINQSQSNLVFYDLQVSSGAYSNTYDARTFTLQSQFEANSSADFFFYRGTTSTFNATDEVNSNTNFIEIDGNAFAANDLVRYFTDTGNTALTGLSNNAFYYVLASNSTGIILTTEAANTLANVNITQGSNVVTFNSNTNVQNSNDFISIASANSLFANGDQVRYLTTDGITSVPGLEANSLYYVRYANTTGLKLSETVSGDIIDITALAPGDDGHFLRYYNVNRGGHSIRNYRNEFANGQIVQYRIPNGNTAITGLTANATYYVVAANNVGFKLSLTQGGSANAITANSTGGEAHTIATLPGYLPKDKLFQTNSIGGIVNSFVSSVFSNTHESVVRNYIRITGNNAPIVNNALIFSYTVPTANGLVTNVTPFEIISTAKAIVKSSNSTQILAKRITFENTWQSGGTVIGEVTGAQADVTSVSEDARVLYPIGLNADLVANVVTANGEVSSLQVIDSGFAYSNGEIVDFVSEDNLRAGSAKMILDGHGIGKGFYRSSKGFLSDDIYIHDGDYYQEYSYEILSKISVERYADMFKKVMHVAGTRFFGSALIVEEANIATTLSSISTGEQVQFNSAADVNTLDDTIQMDIEDAVYTFEVKEVNDDDDFIRLIQQIALGSNTYYNTQVLNVHDYLQYSTEETQTIGVGTSDQLSNNDYYYVVFANTSGIKISETRGGDPLNLNTAAILDKLEEHTFTRVINPFANGDLVLYTTSNTAVQGLSNSTNYYVVNTTPNTVKLSLTVNGSPINITANGSSDENATAGHFLTKTIEE